MVPETVVLTGELPLDVEKLRVIAGEFGWSIDDAPDPEALRRLGERKNPVAVLFYAGALDHSWRAHLHAIQLAAPHAFPIVCHGTARPIPWAEMADAGVFHAVRLPLESSEVRQSLGFVWAARRGHSKPFLMPALTPARIPQASAPAALKQQAKGSVA